MVEAIVCMDSDKSSAEISCGKSSSATRAYDQVKQCSLAARLQHTTCTSKAFTNRFTTPNMQLQEAWCHCRAKLRLGESTRMQEPLCPSLGCREYG